MKKRISPLYLAIIIVCSCTSDSEKPPSADFSLSFEKYELPNGLDVILHEDKSDPIATVAVVIHAGSNREVAGRTGFAHFFEHMLFKRSENVPDGYFNSKISEWGGVRNGYTNKDQTVYYETLPNDALEKALWMESDRMGFLINSVTQNAFETEKEVVQNEKRQRVDNAPYGHTDYVIKKTLYPPNHPYHWTTIGEFEDLKSATLDDLKQFYDRWYGPNNATLVVSGSFDKGQVMQWIEKYFSEIKPHGEIVSIVPQPVEWKNTQHLYHEDNFAKLPELTMVFPTVEQYHKDYWALNALGELLYSGKRAPLYKVIVEEKKLASIAYAYGNSLEIAGTFEFSVTANENVDLDQVQDAIFEALARFEKEGVDDKDLARIKTTLETNFYNGISSVQNKSFQLANYNIFAGDPGFIKKDIENILAVSKEDVIDVYNKYLKGKPFLTTSFVPKDQLSLAIAGSVSAEVREEVILPNKEQAVAKSEDNYERSPTTFDRTVEPAFGPAPLLTPPPIWDASLSNGMKVLGIHTSELPLVSFSVKIKGGLRGDELSKAGTSYMLSKLLTEGTKSKTPEELEDALGQLGVNISCFASAEDITIYVNCLSRNYPKAVKLLEEILLEPRWDEKEFDRIKLEQFSDMKQRDATPTSISMQVFNRVIYGPDHILSKPVEGTEETVMGISLNDLRQYYQQYFAPTQATFHLAGNISQEQVVSSLQSLASKWSARDVTLPEYTIDSTAKHGVYFVDIPDAKQSVVWIGNLAVNGSNFEDYHILNFSINQLGGGGYSRLYKSLRIEKGYTYGAYAQLFRRTDTSPIINYASVRSNVTAESVELFRKLITEYPESYTQEDLDMTKSIFIKRNARFYETIGNLLGILHNTSTYNLPLNYLAEEQAITNTLTVDQVKAVMSEKLNPENLIYVVAGDKKTQFESLKKIKGLGPIKIVSSVNIPPSK